MSNSNRVMYHGTVRAPPLREQFRAAALAGCTELTTEPREYLLFRGPVRTGGAGRSALRPGIRRILGNIPDLATAWAIVDGVRAPNSGILLDIWHYSRSRPDDALLRNIPGDRITGVQLSDAAPALTPGAGILDDTINRRKPRGKGSSLRARWCRSCARSAASTIPARKSSRRSSTPCRPRRSPQGAATV